MTNTEQSILKEFNKHRIKSDEIALIMSRLDTTEKQNQFLSFLIINRNAYLTISDMLKTIYEMEVV